MVLVRFGWIHTKFCSFALALLHQLQQRKLILAKNEEQKKKQSKHRIAKNNPTRFTRKTTKQKKHKNGKKTSIKTWSSTSFIILCFPSLFFSVCSGFVCLKPCILYAVRLFRLNKRGVWPKKALGRTATGN